MKEIKNLLTYFCKGDFSVYLLSSLVDPHDNQHLNLSCLGRLYNNSKLRLTLAFNYATKGERI